MEDIFWDIDETEDNNVMLNRYLGVAFCIAEGQIHAILVNSRGEMIENVRLKDKMDDILTVIQEYLDEVVKEKEIKAIGIGMPGVVERKGFWRVHSCSGEGYSLDIGTILFGRYQIPVVLENDLNATAIGIGLGYGRGVSYKNFKEVNMAYLYFNECSINAGLIAGGEVIHGCNNCAGELGMIPLENNKLIYKFLSDPMDDKQYASFVINIIIWICAILNPQYVALGGSGVRKGCVGLIAEELHTRLAPKLFAEIVFSHDEWHDYQEGMAYLTAKKVLEEVRHMI